MSTVLLEPEVANQQARALAIMAENKPEGRYAGIASD